MTLRFAPRAVSQLANIREYLAARRPESAEFVRGGILCEHRPAAGDSEDGARRDSSRNTRTGGGRITVCHRVSGRSSTMTNSWSSVYFTPHRTANFLKCAQAPRQGSKPEGRRRGAAPFTRAQRRVSGGRPKLRAAILEGWRGRGRAQITLCLSAMFSASISIDPTKPAYSLAHLPTAPVEMQEAFENLPGEQQTIKSGNITIKFKLLANGFVVERRSKGKPEMREWRYSIRSAKSFWLIRPLSSKSISTGANGN